MPHAATKCGLLLNGAQLHSVTEAIPEGLTTLPEAGTTTLL